MNTFQQASLAHYQRVFSGAWMNLSPQTDYRLCIRTPIERQQKAAEMMREAWRRTLLGHARKLNHV
jgi:hypothetical protein